MPRNLKEATRSNLCPSIDSSISLLDVLLLIINNLVLPMFRDSLLERNHSVNIEILSFTILTKGTIRGPDA